MLQHKFATFITKDNAKIPQNINLRFQVNNILVNAIRQEKLKEVKHMSMFCKKIFGLQQPCSLVI